MYSSVIVCSWISTGSVPSGRATLNGNQTLEITNIGRKQHFTTTKEPSWGSWFLGCTFNICHSTFHQRTVGGAAQPAASKAKTAHSRSMAATCAGEHLESVGIFLKICPEKWPAWQELLLFGALNKCRSFRIDGMPDWGVSQREKLEKSRVKTTKIVTTHRHSFSSACPSVYSRMGGLYLTIGDLYRIDWNNPKLLRTNVWWASVCRESLNRTATNQHDITWP